MKVFFQNKGESIIINGEITVTVLEIEGEEVILGIDAPQWVAIEERPEEKPEMQLEAAGNGVSHRAK